MAIDLERKKEEERFEFGCWFFWYGLLQWKTWAIWVDLYRPVRERERERERERKAGRRERESDTFVSFGGSGEVDRIIKKMGLSSLTLDET